MSIIEKAVGKQNHGAGDAARPSIIASAAEAAQKAAEERAAASAASATTNTPAQPTSPVEPAQAVQAAAPQAAPTTAPAAGKARAAHESQRVEINLQRLQGLGMLTPDSSRTPISQEFRLIKRPLIEKAFDTTEGDVQRHGNLIMVTSALPGEGKTFCAANLAISIAMEMDHTVLLVDADVARPSLPEFLGLRTEAGLMDVLLDEKRDLADVMLKTNIESLSFLPAGKSHRYATELLASQSMSRLLDEIARRYPDRIVIFDSPPVLLTSEARVLASQMGQIVLVVEAEKTTQHALKTVLRQLDAPAKINLLYNKSRESGSEEYYGRYYN